MPVRRKRTVLPKLTAPVAIRLAEDDAAVPELQWIHIANEGSYLGHHQGPFELARADLDTMVKNFRADPRYSASDEGVGQAKVVPFDYEHASEMAPFLGSIPQGGAPAPAWALDLKVENDADGRAQLFALAKLGKKIRGQMDEGEYAFVSMAFTDKATHPETGAKLGHKISSIAFTNQPFIRDLQPIAARARGLNEFFAFPAGSAEEAFNQLREMLGLGVSTAPGDVQAEVLKILDMSRGRIDTPPGLDAAEAVAAIRTTFNLPVTASLEDIESEVGVAAGSLIQPQLQPGEAPPGSPPPGGTTTSATHQEPDIMPLSELGKKVALSVRKHGVTLNKVITLQEDVDAEAAVDELAANSSSLSEILKAMGVKDPTAALSNIAELRDAESKLSAAQAELAEALAVTQQVEQAQATADVAAALKAKGFDKAAQPALLSHRAQLLGDAKKALPETATVDQRKAAVDGARTAFFSHYGVVAADQEYLLKNFVAAPDAQLDPPAVVPAGTSQVATPRGDGGSTIDLSAFDGRNGTEKIMAYLGSKDAGFAKLPLQARIKKAGMLRRQEGTTFTGI